MARRAVYARVLRYKGQCIPCVLPCNNFKPCKCIHNLNNSALYSNVPSSVIVQGYSSELIALETINVCSAVETRNTQARASVTMRRDPPCDMINTKYNMVYYGRYDLKIKINKSQNVIKHNCKCAIVLYKVVNNIINTRLVGKYIYI